MPFFRVVVPKMMLVGCNLFVLMTGFIVSTLLTEVEEEDHYTTQSLKNLDFYVKKLTQILCLSVI